MRRALLFLFAASAMILGGCVAGMAASAVGMAVRSAQTKPQSNEALQPVARKACTDRASPYGAVHIIDIEQRSQTRIIVWGTVGEGNQRRSFECGFGTKIHYFRLRAIRPRG